MTQLTYKRLTHAERKRYHAIVKAKGESWSDFRKAMADWEATELKTKGKMYWSVFKGFIAICSIPTRWMQLQSFFFEMRNKYGCNAVAYDTFPDHDPNC